MQIISVGDLKIGMFVAEPDCPWSEFNFALQGFVVSSPAEIDIFQSRCRFVYIDRSRSLAEQYAPPTNEKDRPRKFSPLPKAEVEQASPGQHVAAAVVTVKRQERRRRLLTFLHGQKDNEQARQLSQELARIEPAYDSLGSALQETFKAFSENQSTVDTTVLKGGVEEITGSLQRNPDAVMWLLRLKQCDQYSFDHAMDVAVNMVLIGAHIGWRGPRLLNLGLAGILQDVGKLQLPGELLAKKTPFTAAEFKVLRSHVALSMKMLQSQAGIPSDVIDTVARHHERWDGSGYPAGLKFEQIGMAAEIAGLADSHCAMLRDKPYRRALGHQEALEKLHNRRGTLFNPALMEQFVQCIGLYPIGTLVELNSGEVGVVIQQNRVRRSKPCVLLLLDADKQQVPTHRTIDLREKANTALRVAKALPYNAYGLNANDYYLG